MNHMGFADCSAETLFPDAAIGFQMGPYWEWRSDMAINPIYGVTEDPLKVPGCVMCLVKFFDGSPVAVRYKRSQIRKIDGGGINDLHRVIPRTTYTR